MGTRTRLPLRFEPNVGQAAADVLFLARGNGYGLYLTADESVVALRREAGSAAVRLKLLGAAAAPESRGLDRLPGKSNYFLGDDPGKWRTGVAQYARVEQRGVYPGIDLEYYGKEGEVEYDFIVAPGADPGQIRLGIEGAWARIDRNGNLVLSADGGQIVHRAPVLHQPRGDERVPVSGHFVLRGPSEVGFEVGAYDPSLPLVIDPVLSYSTFLSGSLSETAAAVSVDAAGNAYVTGITHSPDFPIVNALQPSRADEYDAFVAKLDPSGSTLVYSTYFGGHGNDRGLAIAIDASGSAYIAGDTTSTDLPTVNPLQSTFGGDYDAFVAKLDPSGSALLYSTYLGGTNYDVAEAVAVDAAGKAYLTGRTLSADFPRANAFQPGYGGGSSDAFVAVLDDTGSALVYSTFLGGNSEDYGRSIAVDAAGAAYVTGWTSSANFPTASPFQAVKRAGLDGFVTKLTPTGSGLVYSTFLGGNGTDAAEDIAVDGAGSAYVTGYTYSADFPTVAAFQPSPGGGNDDAFATKLSPSGSSLVYSTYLGGSNSDSGYAVAVDAAGRLYVAGGTDSSNFPTVGALQPGSGGGQDGFVAQLSASGSTLEYSSYLGGSDSEGVNELALNPSGYVYVTGGTSSTGFPTTEGAFQRAFTGHFAGFVTRFWWPSDTADLQVQKWDGRSEVLAGETVTYTISVTNLGPDDVTNAAVTDPLPAALLSTSWTCAAAPGSSCDAATGSGDLNTQVSLAANGFATFTVTGTVDFHARGSLFNTARVIPPAGVTDPVPGDDSATDQDAIVPVPSVDLRVNGADAIYPQYVTTTGHVRLTLDMTAGTKPLHHYYYLWSGGTVYWYTPSGFSTAPAPLATFTPADLTDVVLLDTVLARGTCVFGWIMLDEHGSYVQGDQIVVAVVP